MGCWEAGRDLGLGGCGGARAGPGDTPLRQQRGLQTLFSSRSWDCSGTGRRDVGLKSLVAETSVSTNAGGN